RVFGQIGGGENWAPESQLYLAGANPEDMMQNPLTRSMGLTPQDFYGYGISTGNFQSGGGLGLRGYNNYLAPGLNSDSLFRYGYDGMSGVAFNTEFEFDDLVRIQGKWKRLVELKTYLFADAGIININRNDESLEWAKVRMDAGFGSTLEIKRWGKLNDWKPLKIRLDFPLFLNRVPAGEDYVQFRWLIGFDRAF
ncbi:MAG: M1 family peptidase, partial [Flavobacteriales bacterium]|nr:M1 family peptidase [Flavobacteriales bacterium]